DEEKTKGQVKKNWLLTCKNVKDALAAAGYVGSNKPKVLWNDLCLQATAEIVWNWAGCAEYLSASPNLSISNFFVDIFASMQSSCTALDFGKLVASVYHNICKARALLYSDNKSWSSGCSMDTWSLISLDQSKADALKNAVDNFALSLLDLKASDNAAFNAVYTSCVRQSPESYADCKGLAYCGTFAFLNDLGWLAKDVEAYAQTNSLTQLKSAASALKELLKNGDDKLIVYAWGGRRATDGEYEERTENQKTYKLWKNLTANSMYLTGQKDFMSGAAVEVENPDDYYGMTIVASPRWAWHAPAQSGDPVRVRGQSSAVDNYYDWTGFSQKWEQVIQAWRDAELAGGFGGNP
ncbi:MAG: hypothetical protein J5700_01745, partial [Treponema sp.]|nr:hypothetical protein [Treponema sp.]